ncbi:hypothetical protein CK203_015792 [Vitis vinifera]|uniref:Mitochondrial protein n=1 Tax=Vitis vinifera TaxID=29760 RepID=A0A438JRN6_VITVI|nr:hypothetical protein CK203_015792 [Vitis vinifera]
MDHTKRRMTIMKEMNALKKNGTKKLLNCQEIKGLWVLANASLDVKNVSLNKELEEEVFMDLLPGSIIDQWSTSSYCTFIGGNLASWRSKKQTMVARNNVKAQFGAAVYGIYKLL